MEMVDRLWVVTGRVLQSARDRSLQINHPVYYPRNSKMYHLSEDKLTVNSLTMDMVKEFTPWVIVNTNVYDLVDGKKCLRSSVSTPGVFTLWERVKKFSVWGLGEGELICNLSSG